MISIYYTCLGFSPAVALWASCPDKLCTDKQSCTEYEPPPCTQYHWSGRSHCTHQESPLPDQQFKLISHTNLGPFINHVIPSSSHLLYLPGSKCCDLPPPAHPAIVGVTGVVDECQGRVETHSYPHHLVYRSEWVWHEVILLPCSGATYHCWVPLPALPA